jgi:hypothetical protein
LTKPKPAWRKDRFARAHRLKRAGKRRRHSLDTPIGRKIAIDTFLQAFTNALNWDFTRTKASERPLKAPNDLGQLFFTHLTPQEQAMCIVAPLLNLAHREWEDDKGHTSNAEVRLREDIGQHLHDRLMMKESLKIEAEEICDLRRRSRAKRKGLKGDVREKELKLAAWKARETKKLHKRRRRIAITYLQPDWTPEHLHKAGEWLLEAAKSVAINGRHIFDYDEHGLLKIADWIKAEFNRLRDEFQRRDETREPHLTVPPDWTDFFMIYTDRLPAKFTRNAHPETETALIDAFLRHREFVETNDTSFEGINNRRLGIVGRKTLKSFADLGPHHNGSGRDFEHARGVSAVQRVPLLIDQEMVNLVERFGLKVLDHKRDKKGYNDKEREKIRERDEDILGDDIAAGRRRGNQKFWLTYRCDFRGRLNPIQSLNYGREDHARALFKFSNGMPLGQNGLQWLEIHCANCFGISGSWQERFEWIVEKRDLIKNIASDPPGTVDQWYNLDKPFRSVAACRELAAAWADPLNFVTNLPLAFDATSNALQHYLLIGRIREGAERVNLINYPDGRPGDVYMDVINRAKSMIQTDSGEWADWWRAKIPTDKAKLRKLLKTPVMTSAYGVTDAGVVKQLRDKLGQVMPWHAGSYMAKKLEAAGEDLLPGIKEIKEYIRELATLCAEYDEPLRWTSPTGFPVINRYHESITDSVEFNGRELTFAFRWKDELTKDEAIRGSAPNFVHSLEAAHLARVANSAAEEGIDFIPIHDSYSGLAPQARRLNQIIRVQMPMMYLTYDALGGLRAQNINSNRALPEPPKYGDLNLLEVQNAEYLTN